MEGFRSTGRAQRFLSMFSQISPHFRPRRHLMTDRHRVPHRNTHRFTTWNKITGTITMPTTA
jgi:putative transposase